MSSQRIANRRRSRDLTRHRGYHRGPGRSRVGCARWSGRTFRSRPCYKPCVGETPMAQHDCIEITRDARGVACVTIANAAKLNTLNRAVMAALIDAVEALAARTGVRAVILRGAGTAPSSAAPILTEMATLERHLRARFHHAGASELRRVPPPARAGDRPHPGLRARRRAGGRRRLRHARRRIGRDVRHARSALGIPSVVEAALLPQLIGWGRTRELLLTGDTIDAATAVALGPGRAGVPPDATGCRGGTLCHRNPRVSVLVRSAPKKR